jgi:hypothetical protein
MEIYTQAYSRYMEKCEEFGVKAIDFIDFIRNTTTEQAQSIAGKSGVNKWM